MQVSAEQPWINSRFTLHDSDIEIRSADGFVFQLHRILLETATGAFPGSEIDTRGEIVELTEPANILGILFAFLYPKKQSDLAKEDFSVIMAVAEAAEKYEMFSAMTLCSMRLTKFLPQHAPEILAHAVKHHYPSLIHATVQCFARSPFIPVMEKLPLSLVVPFARYQNAWRSTFGEVLDKIKNLSDSERFTTPLPCNTYYNNSGPRAVCRTCRCSLFTIVLDLEAIDSLELLNDALLSPRQKYPRFICCEDGPKISDCTHLNYFCGVLLEKIRQIPSFDTFL
ncbi:hypothetical protein CPB84DRAFT_1817608 [Gymnopilus junonius]|uniref:BTB domain-containing protein n=1 Tax=Gymnopilus junonius TaxID=109634 RepID=A0A9P5NDH1_GYMJU|nr:hypothetical protein CPB84DRAFT_1817608 [Gymnopilus junonius]